MPRCLGLAGICRPVAGPQRFARVWLQVEALYDAHEMRPWLGFLPVRRGALRLVPAALRGRALV